MKDILIVDDNDDIRRLLRHTLEPEYQVWEASDGIGALQVVRELHPKLVFLDVMMPGELNGLQVLNAIREDKDLRETQVVMITARGQEEDYENARKHGADGYIVKPFGTQGLLDWVRANLK